MIRPRLELALERLKPSDWERFENLASTFLSDEFAALRTVSWPAGDGGKDALLWSPQDDPSVVVQYSVTPDVEEKVRATAKKIAAENPAVSMLIYATNQSIDPKKVDALRVSVRKEHKIALDVRDRRWFLDRCEDSTGKASASEELSALIADPYLAGKGVYDNKGQALSDYDSRVSFVYLSLQLEDDSREKGLTRLSFEALVRAVLRDTDSEHRMSRAEIHRRVGQVLPGHSDADVHRHVDSALKSLTKRFIRHWPKDDEFCLTFDERKRVAGRLADFDSASSRLDREISSAVAAAAKNLGIKLAGAAEDAEKRVRRVVERVLFVKGESFAQGAINDGASALSESDLSSLVTSDTAQNPVVSRQRGALVAVVQSALEALLISPSSETLSFLQSMTGAYTLLAFLRQTTDVQAVVVKMFSDGEIWLDTNIVLPLLAEDLCPDDERQYTELLAAAREAGIRLRITPGVLEEVERHVNRARIYASHSTKWQGGVPFLYSAFVWSGRAGSFSVWSEQFMGTARPQDDIAEYLKDAFGVDIVSLEDQVAQSKADVRHAVSQYWRNVHERRRRDQADLDPMTVDRLIAHDVENCLGVVQRRGTERAAPLGYRSWWLTLDRPAYTCMKEVSAELGVRPAIPGPALSPDFLTVYLTVGPARRSIARGSHHALPLLLDMSVTQVVPPEFVAAAEAVRDQLRLLPDRVRRRRIRDTLDLLKRKAGPLAEGGSEAMMDKIKAVLLGKTTGSEE